MTTLAALKALALAATPGPWRISIARNRGRFGRVFIRGPEDYVAIEAAINRVRLRKAVRAHAIGAGPLPDHNDIFAADDALDEALAKLAAQG
jgi:hypothetical protein